MKYIKRVASRLLDMSLVFLFIVALPVGIASFHILPHAVEAALCIATALLGVCAGVKYGKVPYEWLRLRVGLPLVPFDELNPPRKRKAKSP